MTQTVDMDVNKLPPNSVICLMAPTASGKTALAYELYDTGRFEIISVDSALIYRDMDIGTAKPSKVELAKYPHHLVDIIDPTETYSVANFVRDVEILIADIHQRGKIPLLVGGTMMYYMALFTGLSPVPETDIRVRQEVELWREQSGIEALHRYLQEVDPVIAARLEEGDTQRVTRAVEVYKQTGKPLSDWQQMPKIALADNPSQYWLGLAIMPDRGWLHERIERRLQMMWNDGFFDEVVGLLGKYSLTPDTPALRCVGYRQVVDYLIETKHTAVNTLLSDTNIASNAPHLEDTEEFGIACQAMKNKALYATRQLAKRQYTWLRGLSKQHGLKLDDSKQGGLKKDDLKQNESIVQGVAESAQEIEAQFSSMPHYASILFNSAVKSSKVVLTFSDIAQAKSFLFTSL